MNCEDKWLGSYLKSLHIMFLLKDKMTRFCFVLLTFSIFVLPTCFSIIRNELPPNEHKNPVQLFLLSGQSEAAGAASSTLLLNDATKYATLVGNITQSWLAGPYQDANNDFFISTMKVGKEKETFGPEISFAERIHIVSGKRVMIVKYAWGGTSVKTHWNPDTTKNSWDKVADDGTAAWLLANGGVDFNNQQKLFKNQVYVARRTTEALDDAGVEYEWKAIIWLQGTSDKNSEWMDFGKDTARVFEAMRRYTVGINDLPIVDNGADTGASSLVTGKHYAGQIVYGCNTVYVDHAFIAPRVCSGPECCQTSANNACPDINIFNEDVYNSYGWDPNYATVTTLPVGASDKRFKWYVDYPNNMHSEYAGMILKGRTLASTYLRTFTDVTLPGEMDAGDPSLLFPLAKCAPGIDPTTSDNMCWKDLRSDEEASRVCNMDALEASKMCDGMEFWTVNTSKYSDDVTSVVADILKRPKENTPSNEVSFTSNFARCLDGSPYKYYTCLNHES